MNIYVGNLSHQTSEDDLKEAFESFGKITAVNIIKDKFTSESKGFGFVEMEAKDDAQSAIDQLNGTDLNGKNIIVNEARPKSDKRGGGGFGGGGGFRGRGNR